jgi:hypothetical protein
VNKKHVNDQEPKAYPKQAVFLLHMALLKVEFSCSQNMGIRHQILASLIIGYVFDAWKYVDTISYCTSVMIQSMGGEGFYFEWPELQSV